MSDRIAEFEAKVSRNPGDTLARFVLAKDLLEAGRLEPAIGHLEELVGQKPDWMKAWILLGQGLKDAGRKPQARRALEQALTLARSQHHEGPEGEIAALLADLGE